MMNREGDFIKQIDNNSYNSFVDRYFLLYRRGILNSKVKRDKIIQYKSTPIKKPLLKEAVSCHKSAVQINRLILHYVQENDATDDMSLLDSYRDIRHIISLVMENYRILRNEVYCQLMKTLTSNDPYILERAWMILAVICSSIAPIEELYAHIINLCAAVNTSGGFDRLPIICARLLRNTMILKRRHEVPTNSEISAILVSIDSLIYEQSEGTVAIRVYLYNGNYVTIKVAPGTTVNQLQKSIGHQLNLGSNEQYFQLYEDRSDGGYNSLNCLFLAENRLDEDLQVLDRVAMWQRSYLDSKKRGKDAPTFYFVYHTFLYVDLDQNYPSQVELMFIQAVHDMKVNRYPCTLIDMITLLALYLRSRFGEQELEDDLFEYFMRLLVKYSEAIDTYIPRIEESESELDYAKQKLILFYNKLQRRSRDWYINAYMEYIMSWELYGIEIFDAEVLG